MVRSLPVDKDTWRTLLKAALEVVDSLLDRGYGELDFRLGGGTVLMFRFDHRLSKDIDIFTHDAQALSFISPRLNDVAERASVSYEEHANVVKLLLPEGDIDFIVAAPVIPGAPCEAMRFEGRSIALDCTAEILAKKLLFRADSFKVRDVFDLATALAHDPAAAMAALAATRRTRPALRRRLLAMQEMTEAELGSEIVPTLAGEVIVADMLDMVRRAVELDAGNGGRG